jgi:outer membrane protein assembly factor BamB
MKRLLLFCLILEGFGCGSSPRLLWKFKTGSAVYSSPSIAGNLVVIGSMDLFLYALDTQSGKNVWKKNLGGKIISKPFVKSNILYVGGGNDFYAIDSANGQIQWRFRTDGLVEYNPCSEGEALYFGNGLGHFYRINFDGKKVWEYSTSDAFTAHCVIYNNLVIAGGWDRYFYGFDRATGKVVWKYYTGLIHYGGPDLLEDTLYFATHNDLYKMEASTGKVLRKVKTEYLNDVVIDHNFLWTNENGLSKRDLDGNVLGTAIFRPFPHYRPVVGNGLFVVSTADNSVYGISPDLKILWKYKEKGPFWSPGVIHNNVYYTGNRNSYVYALRLPEQ